MKRIFAALLCLIMLLSLCACAKEKSIDLSDKMYTYEKDGFGSSFTITFEKGGTYTYYEGFLSSYIGCGKWEVSGNRLTMTENEEIGYPFVFYFDIDGDDLVFDAENSSQFIYVHVADGERFTFLTDTITTFAAE